MRYKEDWDAAKQRFTAFWNREIIDRCCVSVAVYNVKGLPAGRGPETDAEKERAYMDTEFRVKSLREAMENTYYGGEAFPMAFLNLGAAGHAGYFRGEKHSFDNTVWFYPFMEDTDHMPEFDRSMPLYQKTLELAKAFAEDSRGDYIISMPDTSGNADVLSHMMGAENMMTAMVEDPEGVERCLAKIQESYEDILPKVYDIVKENNDGGSAVGWLNTWAPGFHAQMQCDMSVMISNPHFKQFILPELRTQSRFLEYALYHFDGIEQRRHLDDLLSIPELKCIQWTQVAGQPPCTDFIDDLKKIQAAGKNLLIIVSPDQIRPLMENLSSRGLYFVTDAPSVDEAETLLKDVAKWTKD